MEKSKYGDEFHESEFFENEGIGDLTLKYFKEITAIPRPSGSEDKIRQYLIDLAISRNLEYRCDDAGNLVIYVPATKDKIDSDIVVLQSHIDMVCVKDEDYIHDFYTDPIRIYEENGFLMSYKTTLGADNGVGVALMLASLDTVSHPSMELLFSVDEEVGLTGALNFDGSMISGRKMINLDNEDEGTICISSAGGARLNIFGNLDLCDGNFKQFRINISGMKGGHSGVEIDKNRGNAIHLLIMFLDGYKGDYELVGINGGIADNVIPSTCEMILGISDLQNFNNQFSKYIDDYKSKHDCPDLEYSVNSQGQSFKVLVDKSEFISSLAKIDIGVYSISKNIEGLVNSSLNLGVLQMNEGTLKIVYMPRSSISSELDNIIQTLESHYLLRGFKFEVTSKYQGWQENPDNEFIKIVHKIYEDISGKKIKLMAYHAGLECGILADRIGGEIQTLSIGPNIFGAHSTSERVEISSINIISKLLKVVLAEI